MTNTWEHKLLLKVAHTVNEGLKYAVPVQLKPFYLLGMAHEVARKGSTFVTSGRASRALLTAKLPEDEAYKQEGLVSQGMTNLSVQGCKVHCNE